MATFKKTAAQIAAQNTKGLTFSQLTAAHLKEAQTYARSVNRKFSTMEEMTKDALSDAISDALLYVYQNQDKWDSERGPFHVYFGLVVRRLITNGRAVKDGQAISYSNAGSDVDGESTAEFAYYNEQDGADTELAGYEANDKAARLLKTLRANLSPKANALLDCKLEGLENEVIMERLGMENGAVRKGISDLREKVKKVLGIVPAQLEDYEVSRDTYEIISRDEMAQRWAAEF